MDNLHNKPIATIRRGGTNAFGRATLLIQWEDAAQELPDGEYELYARPKSETVLLDSDVKQLDRLSDVERATLVYIAKGFTRKQIAKLVNLSPHRIHDRVKSIYRKLAIDNKADAAVIAAKNGLV